MEGVLGGGGAQPERVRKDPGALEGSQALAVGVGKEGSNRRWRKEKLQASGLRECRQWE